MAEPKAAVIPIRPTTTIVNPTWPVAGDAPSLRTIVQAQAVTMADQAALIDAYQDNLNAAQVPPAPLPTPSGNGTASGTPATTLAVTNLSGGQIVMNAVVAGPGVPAGTTIVSQTSGPAGGNGSYVTSQATTASSAALTFTPPPLPMTWPTPNDAPTLQTIQQQQTAILRTQTALLQQYQDLLNSSQMPAPPTGP
jgi:hypothetical protein